jgi:RNA polymerase sigma factor (sigma-70 family)
MDFIFQIIGGYMNNRYKEVNIEGYINKIQINYENNLIANLDLNRALSLLEPIQREVIRLRFFEGESQYRVANILWKPQALISRLEKKAIKKLREYYQVRLY